MLDTVCVYYTHVPDFGLMPEDDGRKNRPAISKQDRDGPIISGGEGMWLAFVKKNPILGHLINTHKYPSNLTSFDT